MVHSLKSDNYGDNKSNMIKMFMAQYKVKKQGNKLYLPQVRKAMSVGQIKKEVEK